VLHLRRRSSLPHWKQLAGLTCGNVLALTSGCNSAEHLASAELLVYPSTVVRVWLCVSTSNTLKKTSYTNFLTGFLWCFFLHS